MSGDKGYLHKYKSYICLKNYVFIYKKGRKKNMEQIEIKNFSNNFNAHKENDIYKYSLYIYRYFELCKFINQYCGQI